MDRLLPGMMFCAKKRFAPPQLGARILSSRLSQVIYTKRLGPAES
jgi:hypothetical protein